MATIYWRGRSAYIQWRDSHGQHRISLGNVTPPEAEAARIAKEFELATGQPVAHPVGDCPYFSEFADEYAIWFDAHYPSSAYRVKKIITLVLVPAFGSLPLNQFSARVVNDWKIRRSKEPSKRVKNGADPTRLKAESVNKELRQLRAMLHKAVEWQMLDAFPWDKKAVPQLRNLDSKPPQFYEKPQLKKLYIASGERRWWWQLYVNTGMRKAEGLHLQRKHIKRGVLHILSTQEARTKSGKWREVVLNKSALEALKNIPGDDLILPPMHPNSLGRAFARDAQRAGIGGSIHCLRHTFCTQLAMAGVPPRVIQELAGHATLSTTERYMHAAPGAGKAAVRLLAL